MLIAGNAPDTEWKAVSGAQVLFARIDRAMMRRARRAAVAVVGKGEPASGDDDIAAIEELGDAFSEALLIEGVKDWRDVAISVKGGVHEALPFSRDNLALLLRDPVIFDAFDAAYVVPFVTREREKNASAASPSGTGEAVTRASGTASSPAKPKQTGAAKAALTGSRRRSSRKAKASGKS